MFILYGEPNSGSFAPEAILTLAGAEFECVDFDLATHQQQGNAYRAINPMGRIPALRLPSGQLLTESVAILLVLAELFPALELLPPVGSAERFTVYRWLMFISAPIYEAVSRWDYPERFSANPDHAAAIKDKAHADLQQFWRLVENHLQLVTMQNGLGLDLYIANISGWIVGKAWRADNCPGVAAIADGVARDERIGAVWQRHFSKS